MLHDGARGGRRTVAEVPRVRAGAGAGGPRTIQGYRLAGADRLVAPGISHEAAHAHRDRGLFGHYLAVAVLDHGRDLVRPRLGVGVGRWCHWQRGGLGCAPVAPGDRGGQREAGRIGCRHGRRDLEGRRPTRRLARTERDNGRRIGLQRDIDAAKVRVGWESDLGGGAEGGLAPVPLGGITVTRAVHELDAQPRPR